MSMSSRRWIGRGRAAEEYGLTIDQVDYAILLGLLRHKNLGKEGIIVYREDLERNLDIVRSFPKRIWIFKSEAMRRYGLSRNQLELAMKRGLVRFKEVKNPYYSKSKAIMLVIPDIEANLEVIKGYPKHNEQDKNKRRLYYERSKLRKRLEFYCPMCGKKVRPRRDSQVVKAVWGDFMSIDIAIEKLIIAHYRHVHTDYDRDKENIDKWIKEKEVEATAPGFKSFAGLLAYYLEYKDEMEDYEKEDYIEKLNALRRTAIMRAKEYYTEEALRLAEADGLLKREKTQPSIRDNNGT